MYVCDVYFIDGKYILWCNLLAMYRTNCQSHFDIIIDYFLYFKFI